MVQKETIMNKVKGPCFVEGCRRRARVQHECLTCEAKNPDEIHTVKACRKHGARAMQAIRRHALVAHPVNLLRATAAALKGEDVF